jgi:hypothetical protein
VAFPRPQVFAGLIQSSFGDAPHRNFEAVVTLANGELWHYWRDNTASGKQAWKPTVRISTGAAYSGSLIQSNPANPDNAGNFEVVVPIVTNGQVQLTHFWRNHVPNTPGYNTWMQGGIVTLPTDRVVGPGCIIQSAYGKDVNNFEVVVPVEDSAGNLVLQHYYREDPFNPAQPWKRGSTVTPPGDTVTGPGCIMQSTRNADGNRRGGDLQIVVPTARAGGPPQLRLFSRKGIDGPWSANPAPVTRSGDVVAGGAVIIESDFGDGGGNFEVLVGLRMPSGNIEGSTSLLARHHRHRDLDLWATRDGLGQRHHRAAARQPRHS